MKRSAKRERVIGRVDEIAKLAAQGKPIGEIAKEMGVSCPTLLKYRKSCEKVALALEGKTLEQQEKLRLKEKEEAIMNACFKRACGYIAKEEVRELKEEKETDGSVNKKLRLTKVVHKEVPADLAAAKYFLEKKLNDLGQEDAKEVNSLFEAQAVLQERDRLLSQLKKEKKG